jgi:hypothetical protein
MIGSVSVCQKATMYTAIMITPISSRDPGIHRAGAIFDGGGEFTIL